MLKDQKPYNIYNPSLENIPFINPRKATSDVCAREQDKSNKKKTKQKLQIISNNLKWHISLTHQTERGNKFDLFPSYAVFDLLIWICVNIIRYYAIITLFCFSIFCSYYYCNVSSSFLSCMIKNDRGIMILFVETTSSTDPFSPLQNTIRSDIHISNKPSEYKILLYIIKTRLLSTITRCSNI